MSAPLYDALDRAVKALQAHPDLPPSISVSMTDDGLWVTPYERGAPITALLGWHDALKDVTRELESYVSEAGSYRKVTVRGLLDDVPIVAQTVTFQELTGSRTGRVSEAELRRIAKMEEPF